MPLTKHEKALFANRREAIRQAGLSESRGAPCSEHWHVEVSVNGETVLAIGHNFLSGVDDIHEHAETIRTAANHLLGFIGDAQNVERQGRGPAAYPARSGSEENV
jgi:hypothetical protein